MNRHRVFLARLALALAALLMRCASAQKLVTPGYLFNSDPTCRQIGDTFYLFTTQDPFTVEFQRDNSFFRGMYAYHAFSTIDFDHWVDHGSILTGRDVNWNAGGGAAPGLLRLIALRKIRQPGLITAHISPAAAAW